MLQVASVARQPDAAPASSVPAGPLASLQFGTFGESSHCNWIHIQYQARGVQGGGGVCCSWQHVALGGCLLQLSAPGLGCPAGWLTLLARAARPQNKHAAQRALLHNGEQLSAACMVGVKPLDAAHRAAVEKAGAAGGSGQSFAVAFPKPQQQRPYTLEASAGGAGVVPLATKGLTQRVKEFVLGC